MRATLSTLSPIAAGAFLAAAATPALAQQAAQSATRQVAVAASSAAPTADGVTPRPVASYRFTPSRDGRLPAQITVADSAGGLVASFRLPGRRSAQPMLVEVINTDLVLQGETPAGPLTLVLYGANDSLAGRTVSGRWWVAGDEGELRGYGAR